LRKQKGGLNSLDVQGSVVVVYSWQNLHMYDVSFKNLSMCDYIFPLGTGTLASLDNQI
jgi:hypothetical protein